MRDLEVPSFVRDYEDYIIVFGGITVAIMGGLLRHMYVLEGNVIYFLTLLVLLAAPVSIYFGKKVWGGEVGRTFELVSIGLVCVMVNRIPQITYNLTNWNILGLSVRFWAGFFNFLGAVGFAIVSYGFYRFWKVAKVDA